VPDVATSRMTIPTTLPRVAPSAITNAHFSGAPRYRVGRYAIETDDSGLTPLAAVGPYRRRHGAGAEAATRLAGLAVGASPPCTMCFFSICRESSYKEVWFH
jgi:hypothetical protein